MHFPVRDWTIVAVTLLTTLSTSLRTRKRACASGASYFLTGRNITQWLSNDCAFNMHSRRAL